MATYFGYGDGFIISGDDTAETLGGSRGADVIQGFAGSDVITGGLGDDTIYGGDGHDTAVFSGVMSQYSLQGFAHAFKISGPDGADTVFDVEELRFADLSVSGDALADLLGGRVLIGDDSDNVLTGSRLNDVLHGHGGNDWLVGGGGDDALFGDDGYVSGPLSQYSFFGRPANFEVSGPDGRDSLLGIEELRFADQAVSGDALDRLVLDQPPAPAAAPAVAEPTHAIYRFFDTATGHHFYTTSAVEKDGLIATVPAFSYEGAPWATPEKGANTQDVFRFFDKRTGDHFYTSNAGERDHILSTLPHFAFEGVAFQTYADTSMPGTFALERFFNTKSGEHHFAANAAEAAGINAGAAGPGWVDEGAGFIVHHPGPDMLLA